MQRRSTISFESNKAVIWSSIIRRDGNSFKSRFSLEMSGRPLTNSADGNEFLILSNAEFGLCAKLSGWQ